MLLERWCFHQGQAIIGNVEAGKYQDDYDHTFTWMRLLRIILIMFLMEHQILLLLALIV
jgi:hypothetical protein